MKAIYVSPVTEILYTEISPVMDKISPGLSPKGDILHDASTQMDKTGPGIYGDEGHEGGDDLDAAKRNWNCWDIE